MRTRSVVALLGATLGACRFQPLPEIGSQHDAAVPFDAMRDAMPDADSSPPTIESTSPEFGMVGVDRATTVTVEFDEPVLHVDSVSFMVTPSVTGTVSSTSLTTWVLTPSATLQAATTYSVTLSTAITDVPGNAFAGKTFNFVTAP